MTCARIDIGHAAVIIAFGTDPDLHRTGDINQPQLDRFVHKCAVVDPVHIVVGPKIGMGIKLDHRQRPVFRSIGPQDRQGDKVIAAQGHRRGACIDDALDMRLKQSGKAGRMGVVKG